MHTEFKKLDNLINIAQPEVILLTGTDIFVNILSGDIANNICLHQEKEVLDIRLFKDMSKISKKLNCPILIVYKSDIKYNSEIHQQNYLVKKDIELLENINKYIDKFIIANIDKTKQEEHIYLFNLNIYNSNSIIGKCELNYDCRYRRFIDH